MSVIKPFKAVRPQAGFAGKVAALPYDVMNLEEAKEMAKDNPYSFLHIDRAEIDLPDFVHYYDDKVYEKAADNFSAMQNSGVYIQDDSPKLYIYRQVMDARTQTGLVACVPVDEYLDGKIKKHELTREDKEIDRIKHIGAVGAHTGPIFLAYKNENEIAGFINQYAETHASLYDFVTDDNIKHTAWVIEDETLTGTIIKKFEKVNSLYIADGHHRSASAAKTALAKRNENAEFTGDEGFNYFLSIIFPHDELYIMAYNRLVKDLNGNSVSEFLDKIGVNFEISKTENDFEPQHKNELGLYVDQNWYRLVPRHITAGNVSDSLDVSILQNEILSPILNIKDLRTDKRIDFVGGAKGISRLMEEVDSGKAACAFALYPTSMKELMAIADENEIMPPKSTWFEPKLRSGLFIHMLT